MKFPQLFYCATYREPFLCIFKLAAVTISTYSSVDIALGYGLDGRGSRRRPGIFLFNTTSRTALGPTQSPIKWVPGALSLGVKWQGHEADP
jgi:hypothetical protein